MTDAQRVIEIQAIDTTIAQYRAMIKEILLSGTASGSMGSAGNSQSYTRIDIPTFRLEIKQLSEERAVLVNASRSRRSSPDFDGGY